MAGHQRDPEIDRGNGRQRHSVVEPPPGRVPRPADVTGQAASSNLVLASGSRVRRTLLTGAGLDPKVDPADLDEPAIEADCRLRGLDTPATALELAEAKATLVAARHPGAIVVACDQMLDVGGESLRKAADMAGAAATLRRLAGR
ncbi:MAG: hypothetical protein CMM61_00895, partial [Rhodospirillaceae bacterium]|nr:hypothetical protein [Rhodospirillaceae bacterium]